MHRQRGRSLSAHSSENNTATPLRSLSASQHHQPSQTNKLLYSTISMLLRLSAAYLSLWLSHSALKACVYCAW